MDRSPLLRGRVELCLPPRTVVALGRDRPVVMPVRGSELLPLRQRRGTGGGGSLGMPVSEMLPVGDDGSPGTHAAVKRSKKHRRADDSPEDDHPDKPPAQRSAASVLPSHTQALPCLSSGRLSRLRSFCQPIQGAASQDAVLATTRSPAARRAPDQRGYTTAGSRVKLRYRWIERTTEEPSPTAAATRFIEPSRMSPAANSPSTDVS